MGRYPDFFYDYEPFDPCEGCLDYVDGRCSSDGGCAFSTLSDVELIELYGEQYEM